jgi:2-amino-4-hydroxy-6-hydroxymethyldihydropteridine diphosphokinase
MSRSSSNVKPDGRPAAAAVVSLGSNMGEREKNVLSAAARIASSAGVSSARLSSLYETAPLGEGYSRSFVNAVMIIATTLSPRALLALAQGLEREAGRARAEGAGDRPLDVDIILCGSAVVDDPDLTIPHPRFMERLFVLAPLAELDPGFMLPGGLTASEAAASDSAEGMVERISSRSRIPRKSLKTGKY